MGPISQSFIYDLLLDFLWPVDHAENDEMLIPNLDSKGHCSSPQSDGTLLLSHEQT